jgi:hypothetical protein
MALTKRKTRPGTIWNIDTYSVDSFLPAKFIDAGRSQKSCLRDAAVNYLNYKRFLLTVV